MDYFPNNTSIYLGFPVAMFDYQRVTTKKKQGVRSNSNANHLGSLFVPCPTDEGVKPVDSCVDILQSHPK